VLQEQVERKFREALISGELVATGRDARESGERGAKRIPSDSWSTLELNFDNSTATGGGFSYAAVQIGSVKLAKIATVRECTTWLEEEIRSGRGPKNKEKLWAKAAKKFGVKLSRHQYDTYVWPALRRLLGPRRGTKLGKIN
jgi:hypothetical protein